MDLRIGRCVKVTLSPEGSCEIGVVECIKTGWNLMYPVQVRWPDDGYTMCAYSELAPLCDNCGRVACMHEEDTRKCLFGPGVWK